MTQTPFIENNLTEEDISFDAPLRPPSLKDFVGQSPVKDRLSVVIEAAKKRGEVLGHALFAGPPGLGKTTLSHIIAKEMGTQCVITSGASLDKAGDLAGILTNLEHGDVLFIDEIHRLQRSVEEYLYPALEDFAIDLVIDSGANARSVQIQLKPFTLVAATTRVGLISAPLRTRFATTLRLDYYSSEELISVLKRTATLLHLELTDSVALEIANRSRGTPRIANHLLRWVRDYVEVKGEGVIENTLARKALKMLAIDENGLDEIDRKLLQLMIENYNGGPVGLSTLAAACGEEPKTIEEVYEPFLIKCGLIKKTARGRVATEKAFAVLN